MIVNFKTILRGETAREEQREKPSDVREVKPITIQFCCGPMEKAFAEDMIGFSDWCEYPQEDPHVNIYGQISHVDLMHLNFCPFCRAKIKVNNVRTVEIRLKPRQKKVLKTWDEELEIPVKKTKEEGKNHVPSLAR